jgi:hypothetical protein
VRWKPPETISDARVLCSAFPAQLNGRSIVIQAGVDWGTDVKTNLLPRDIAEAVGGAVIRAEHDEFVAHFVDNTEHVARVRRIAVGVAAGLQGLGISRSQAGAVSKSLLEFGKELFMGEWMAHLGEGETPDVVFAEGSAEFDRILAKKVSDAFEG